MLEDVHELHVEPPLLVKTVTHGTSSTSKKLNTIDGWTILKLGTKDTVKAPVLMALPLAPFFSELYIS